MAPELHTATNTSLEFKLKDDICVTGVLDVHGTPRGQAEEEESQGHSLD